MDAINKTAFQFAPFLGRLSYPEYSLSFIVKGTFDLSPDQKSVISEEQPPLTGDEFYPEDEEMQGGPRYSTDFSFFKPRADLLLVGKCHAPKGTKVTARHVKFRVGTKSKTLNVFGNRYWKRNLLGSSFTDPEPFAEMELRYENSFGGERYKKNPVGKGIDKIETDSGKKVRPLPNILYPEDRITSPGNRLEPAGFGPMGQMWTQRYSKLGTYKGNYLKERWPWFPKDFDQGHFNAAPEDMQVEGYLKGDEELYFENLHPVHSIYRSQLPSLRIRCFLNESDSANGNDTHFKEVSMKLDTLLVDMENEKLVLVWRGVTNVKSEEYEEIKHVFIISEKLEEAARPVDYYSQQLIKKLSEIEEEEGFKPEEPEAEEEKEDEEENKEEPENVDDELNAAEEQLRAILIEAGIDPDNPPPLSEEAKKEQARIMKELGLEAEEEENELEETEPPTLTREIVQERIGRGEGFAEEELSDLDLSGLDMIGVNFQGAIFSGVCLKSANLTDTKFTEANLAESDLSGANLKNTDLKGADLTGINLENADLTGALLDDAIFEKAKLDNATLDGVTAKDTSFSEANLTGASLKKSNLQGADFSECILNKVDFRGSVLREATVNGVKGVKVNMDETDLTELRASESPDFSQGSFRKAKGQESVWEEANLTGADFSYSNMEGADFTGANLEGADFFGADLKYSRFIGANLRKARLVKINLFEGSFEKADLSNADLSHSNMYAAEFLEADISNCKTLNTNLKMTKLFKANK